jgi:phosphoglycerate dehydrogenase-like enzyme
MNLIENFSKPLVLVMSYYDAAATAAPLQRLAPWATVRRINPPSLPTADSLVAELNGASVAIIAGEPLTRQVIEGSPELRLLCCDGVGVDNVDLHAATHHGVVVVNAPVVQSATADMVMGLLINLMRKITLADRGVHEGRWQMRPHYYGRDVHGSTLGLVGFGRVARCVAQRAEGFGMRLLAHSPNADVAVARRLGVEIVALDELLAQSDVVSIHVPLNDNTRDLIDFEQLALMKSGAYLINTSRGAVVNELALVSALQTRHLAGAALDVLNEEPPSLDHPLLRMENVIVTPHIGSDTNNTFTRVFDCLVQDITLFLQGKTPLHVVNPESLKRSVVLGESR